MQERAFTESDSIWASVVLQCACASIVYISALFYAYIMHKALKWNNKKSLGMEMFLLIENNTLSSKVSKNCCKPMIIIPIMGKSFPWGYFCYFPKNTKMAAKVAKTWISLPQLLPCITLQNLVFISHSCFLGYGKSDLEKKAIFKA